MITSRALCPALVLVTIASAAATAATLKVESGGLDGPTCGPVTPCRSIATAIANAAVGDAIVVGPGEYDGPGIIAKPLRITSRLGASSTRITGTAYITVSSVTFGRLNNGFTLTSQVLVDASLDGGGPEELVDVRVGGNVFIVPGDVTLAGLLVANTRGRIEHNRVLTPQGSCSWGMFMVNSADLISRNVVMGCSIGINVANARGARLIRNVAVGNETATIVGSGEGFSLTGTVAEFTRNVAMGNVHGVTLGTTTPIPAFSGNAFSGNTSNCGIRNFTAGTLNAAGNFWGAASGPGGDPADAACDFGSAITVTTPFLTSDPSGGLSALR